MFKSKGDELLLLLTYYFLKSWRFWVVAIPLGLIGLGYYIGS